MLQGIVIIYFLVINLVLFSMMGYDKNKQNVGTGVFQNAAY